MIHQKIYKGIDGGIYHCHPVNSQIDMFGDSHSNNILVMISVQEINMVGQPTNSKWDNYKSKHFHNLKWKKKDLKSKEVALFTKVDTYFDKDESLSFHKVFTEIGSLGFTECGKATKWIDVSKLSIVPRVQSSKGISFYFFSLFLFVRLSNY